MARMLMTAWDGWEGAKLVPNLHARVDLQKQRFAGRGLPSSNPFTTYSTDSRATKNNFLGIQKLHETRLERRWGLLEVKEGVFFRICTVGINHLCKADILNLFNACCRSDYFNKSNSC